ncbi:multiple sugar transport system permease protein [Labrenzia sp. EL_208]|uniref:ABC transporter permease subunit n=1 Tax=Roseibium album TaxID=311410 RepID=UPI000CF0B70F|nr:multiple sugar transport system permease protein [Labrenzia sp. EL_142]MBG6159868.1 multiple sugar transport system permease protein [Labrenzia sp. EL_162]MBG6166583.1 multiple sugar transport system permease protein [Labrenzia sp. EL_195]MBG6176640.1 multiple sugar transport system permease protein [Labrenzia sp. EL_132]MBG6198400.1 multiple sugar transport system permease protein [Labrenzia sp. EL_159]MBG6210958.1 multiple sugar transport system permease protein [Labrenzia sp. EL_126]MBG
MTGKQKRQLVDALQVTLILIAIFIMLVPILWIFMAAFKNHIDVFQLKLFFTPSLENFATVFEPPYYLGHKLMNSTIVAFVTVLLAIPIATMAAYSFSRFRLRGETLMLVIILATQFVPAVVIILPFFVMFRDIGLLDTRIGLILVNLSIVMPFAIWMIKGFIDGIPLDTEEAAMVDGSSRIQVILNIVLPMAAPGLLTAGIFCFIIAWNEFLFALILTNKNAVTLPIGLALFKAEEGDLWNLLSAAGIIIMVPMFVLALIIRKYFVQGMTMGAVR